MAKIILASCAIISRLTQRIFTHVKSKSSAQSHIILANFAYNMLLPSVPELHTLSSQIDSIDIKAKCILYFIFQTWNLRIQCSQFAMIALATVHIGLLASRNLKVIGLWGEYLVYDIWSPNKSLPFNEELFSNKLPIKIY